MVEQYSTSLNLELEHDLAAKKIEQIKQNGIRLIAADYDGTLHDKGAPPFNDHLKVIRLADEVSQAGADFAIISARNTTLHVPLRELASAYSQEAGHPFSFWSSGGNGMNLSRVTFTPEGSEVNPIFTNFITTEQAALIVNVFNQMYRELEIESDPKNVAFFNSFLEKELPEDLVQNLIGN